MRPARRWGVIVLILLLLVFVGLVILYQQVDSQSRIDGARHTDVIIVLGSAVWAGGRASPSLYARIQHAITLYKAGYAPYLIMCGGLGSNPPSEAQVMQQLALSAGVPNEALFLDETSHSTEENLANAKSVMDVQGWRSALIVSDPFHLLRSEIIARDLGIEAYGSGASDSPTYTIIRLRMWYTTRETLAIVWYYATRVFGNMTWLYTLLKGRI